MKNKMKTIAIVVAAGKGRRMKSERNKVYLELLGKPVIYYSLMAFEKSEIDEIFIVVSPGYEEYMQKEIVDAYDLKKVAGIIPGGRERFESVFHGILACSSRSDEEDAYILIHDGVRPLIRPEQINTCIDGTRRYKACVLGVPTKDTVRIIGEDGYPVMTPNRSTVWQMQTPQCFLLSEAKEAFQRMMLSGDSDITDDVMVLERYGNRKARMIMGSYDNIKLTTPEDMPIGECLLKLSLGEKK